MAGDSEHNLHWKGYAGAAVIAAGAAGALLFAPPNLIPLGRQMLGQAAFVVLSVAVFLGGLAVVRYRRSRQQATYRASLMGAETILVLPTAQDPTLLAVGRPLKRKKKKPAFAPADSVAQAVRPAWSIDLLQSLDTHRFLVLCEAFYREKGMRCEVRAEERADSLLRLEQTEGASLAQCLATGAGALQSEVIPRLAGLRLRAGLTKAFLMTTGSFAPATRDAAAAERITLINGEMLLSMIKRLPPASEQRLLDLATS